MSEKSIKMEQCQAMTQKNKRCRRMIKGGKCFCHQHRRTEFDCPTCAVCLEDITEDKKLLSCGHSFHSACISKWLCRSQSCPTCRTLTTETENEWALQQQENDSDSEWNPDEERDIIVGVR